MPTDRKTFSRSELNLARQAVPVLRRTRKKRTSSLKVQIGGSDVTLPGAIADILEDCLSFMADGQAVTVLPLEREIGTQEAADILGVSRPYFVKLIDSGAIPSRRVGVQRRVAVSDILNFRERERKARRKVLEQLAAEDQRLGLGE